MVGHGSILSRGFFYLLISQVSSRLVTFVLNLLVTRLLSPEAYGLAAVQFHLINTVILFLSREGFRRGCLRTSTEGDTSGQTARRTLAVSALCIPIGLLVTGVTCKLAFSWQDGEGAATHHAAVRLQGAAAMLELLSEPLYILASVQLRFRLRALVDTAAIVAKSAITVLLLRASRLPPAIALSWAQMAFAAVTLCAYAIAMAPQLSLTQWKTSATTGSQQRDERQQCDLRTVSKCVTDNAAVAADTLEVAQRLRQRHNSHRAPDSSASPSPDMLRRTQRREALIHLPTLRLCGTFSLQAAEKLVLAEGSKMVMVGLQNNYNQGVYGLVVNLGSLIVRTVFQPFEEAAFTAFSTANGQQQQQQQSAQLLVALIRGVAIVGGISAAFGPAYSWLMLRILYSERWSNTEAPAALAVYSFYILLLAVNGILEAFVHASANQRQLVQINVALVVFAAAHMGLSVMLVRLAGAVEGSVPYAGLILADSANMLIRIIFSLICVRHIFAAVASFRLADLWPKAAVVVILLFSLAATGITGAAFLGPTSGGPVARLLWQHSSMEAGWVPGQPFFVRAALHVGAGCSCLVATLLVARRAESRLWAQLRSARANASQTKTAS